MIYAACGPGEVRVAAVRDGVLTDYAIWRPGAPDGVGDLYRGRVRARVPMLAGFFVALAESDGFLPETEAAPDLTEGRVLGVRVVRAAQGGKGPRLSARITAAEQAEIGEGKPALIRRGPGAVERLAALHADLPVLADDPAIVAALRPALAERIQLVPRPAWDGVLAAEIAALAEPVVALPGGGALSIFPTPALTAIDLDTGAGMQGSKTAAHRDFNRSAIAEIGRQIRLRNLSGAILVDWAGLSQRRRRALAPELARVLALDPLQPRLLGFTALGLAEIVRPRIHPPLHALLAGPHAAGLAGLAALVEASANQGQRLRAHPAIVTALEGDAAARADVARLTGRQLRLRADPTMPINSWHVEPEA